MRTTAELIERGRKSPGSLSWGYANGTHQACGAELVNYGGLQATAVPYAGVPQVLTEMLGGRLDFAFIDYTSAGPHIKSGKLRPLAITATKESPALPGVPPLADTIKGFELLGWFGLYAPANTPAPVIATLSRAVLKALEDRGLQEQFGRLGMATFPGDAEMLRKYGISETEKWARLIKVANIKAE